MHVTPPKTWGKVTGTVTGVDCDGTSVPLAGASVQVVTSGASYPLVTDKDGRYERWLDTKYSPLTVIAADKDFESESRKVKLKAGATAAANFALRSSLCVG